MAAKTNFQPLYEWNTIVNDTIDRQKRFLKTAGFSQPNLSIYLTQASAFRGMCEESRKELANRKFQSGGLEHYSYDLILNALHRTALRLDKHAKRIQEYNPLPSNANELVDQFGDMNMNESLSQ